MARNFIYNKTLIMIIVLSSFLFSQTTISTNVFWYKDQFDALPENVKNVLEPELNQMTKDYMNNIQSGLEKGYYGFRTSTPVTQYLGFTKEKFNYDYQDPEAIVPRRYADNPGIRVGSLSTTWKEWLDYHGGYLEMSNFGLTKQDYLDHFASVGIYITWISLGKNNTVTAYTTYLAEEKTLEKGFKVRIHNDSRECSSIYSTFKKYKDKNLMYFFYKKTGTIECWRTPSPIVLDYYGIEMSEGTGSAYSYTNAKGEKIITSVGNYEEVLKGDIITGTYILPDIDFTDIYRVGREKDGKHKKKVKVILKFDDESLGTMEIPFFDIGNHVAFSYNPKIYSEAMRKMAEDLKRKNSWISRQIKK